MSVDNWFACMKCGHALDCTTNYCHSCGTQYPIQLINLRKDVRSVCDSYYFRVTMPDTSDWDVPVCVIAWLRAINCARRQDISIKKAYEDTVKLFEDDIHTIAEWACSSMSWHDVRLFARKVEYAQGMDWQDGLKNGQHRVVSKTLSNDGPDDSVTV